MSVRATPVNRQIGMTIGMTMKIKLDPSIVACSLAVRRAVRDLRPAAGLPGRLPMRL